MSLWKILILNILVSLVIVVLGIFVYDRYFAPKIVSFDLKGFLDIQRKLYMEGKIDEEQLRENFEKLMAIFVMLDKKYKVITGDSAVRNIPVLDIDPETLEFRGIKEPNEKK